MVSAPLPTATPTPAKPAESANDRVYDEMTPLSRADTATPAAAVMELSSMNAATSFDKRFEALSTPTATPKLTLATATATAAENVVASSDAVSDAVTWTDPVPVVVKLSAFLMCASRLFSITFSAIATPTAIARAPLAPNEKARVAAPVTTVIDDVSVA